MIEQAKLLYKIIATATPRLDLLRLVLMGDGPAHQVDRHLVYCESWALQFYFKRPGDSQRQKSACMN